MDTNSRMIAKALSWQALGLVTMTLLGFLFTGSVSAGGALAMASAAIGTAVYCLHEKLWAQIDWGRVQAQAAPEAE